LVTATKADTAPNTSFVSSEWRYAHLSIVIAESLGRPVLLTANSNQYQYSDFFIALEILEKLLVAH